ncbi:hypothetical protein PSEUDO8O_20325 [Pseudomonas sp. 8O]|nr:hypothetical protein PSEUDO8O_20325 [Pseudomonas sp. 8O]
MQGNASGGGSPQHTMIDCVGPPEAGEILARYNRARRVASDGRARRRKRDKRSWL